MTTFENIRKSIAVFVLLFAITLTSDAQTPLASNDVRTALLFGDNQIGAGNRQGEIRSVPLALGMSAVLPGAGQVYNRQWVKAGILVAAEGALILG